MTLDSKPSQADNAERACKCPQCGNSVLGANPGRCDICGTEITSSCTNYVSNEEY